MPMAHHLELPSEPQIMAASRSERTLDELIGARVGGLMRDLGITQARLASALGTDQGSASRRLRGQIAWKATDVEIAANLLGVTSAYLMGADLAASP